MPLPYIFRYFNVCGLHVSTGSGVKSAARLINPLVHALNEEPHLPKYVVVIPDKDVLQFLTAKGSTSAMVIGSTIHYIISPNGYVC